MQNSKKWFTYRLVDDDAVEVLEE